MRKLKNLKWLMLLTPLALLAVVFAPLSSGPSDRVFRADVQREGWTSWVHTLGWRSGESNCYVSCASNLKQIGLAMAQYQSDNEDRFPLTAYSNGAHGWAWEMALYVKNTDLFQCPQQGQPGSGNPNVPGFTDYWMNGNLSGVAQSAMAHPERIFLLGEGNDGIDISDARYSKTSLPNRWIADKTSPAWRHLTHEVWAQGRANYLFGDGHVKGLSAQEVARMSHGDPFRIR